MCPQFLSPAPSATPGSVKVSEVTTSSIAVQWGTIHCIHRNGDIKSYSLQIFVQGDDIPRQTENASTTEQLITGLDPSTTYAIQVAAVNGAGTGVYSDQISVATTGIYTFLLVQGPGLSLYMLSLLYANISCLVT